jgi:hypothetical protein
MREKHRITVESVDLSDFLKDLPALDDRPAGVPTVLTVSGVWDWGVQCTVCHQRFEPGPEGTPHLKDTRTGESYGPVCPLCGVALMAS